MTTVEMSSTDALEAVIGDCVRKFYDKGAKDVLLGPIFDTIPELETHMGVVADFWSKALLGTTRYEGLPFAAHIHLPVEPEHFTRWLELFREAARETLPASQAEQAISRAEHMAQCFQRGLFPFTGKDGRPSRKPG